MNDNIISRDVFLNKKRDFSPFLVHLTREGLDSSGDEIFSARDVLYDFILSERKLLACNYFCIFQEKVNSSSEEIKSKFKVVCFTETPIDQIEVLLERVQGRNIILRPYGLVFKKEYIRQRGGNPVFYITGDLSSPLWTLFDNASKNDFPEVDCKVLALINKCDEVIDFHWEREWRILGDFKFKLEDVFCGLCPEEEIKYFEDKYAPVIFISPHWGINKILDKLVNRNK